MTIGMLLVLGMVLVVPSLVFGILIRTGSGSRPSDQSVGRPPGGLPGGLRNLPAFLAGAGSCLLLCLIWLLPSQVLGRDPHQLEVAGLSVSGALVLGWLTWCSRFPYGGGFSAAYGALLAVTLLFWWVAVVPDSTGQSGVGLFILVFLGSIGLGLVALISAALRVRQRRQV